MVGTDPTPIESAGSPVASRPLGSAATADDEGATDSADGEQAGDTLAAAAPAATAVCEARVGTRGIRRSALKRTLDGGLGNWLRGVEVEPRVERGQFRGWLVQRVYEGDPCWADVDLKAGDIVTRVNRRPIERPEQAHAVWSGLKDARDIVVDYERAGRSRTLRFDVVDDR
jgi:S1-C subfamily serine protease